MIPVLYNTKGKMGNKDILLYAGRVQYKPGGRTQTRQEPQWSLALAHFWSPPFLAALPCSYVARFTACLCSQASLSQRHIHTHSHSRTLLSSLKCCFLATAHRPRGARRCSQIWSLCWSPVSYSCPIMALPRDSAIWSMMKCCGCWRSQKLWVTGTDFERFCF